MSRYWRVSLRTKEGGSLYLFSTASKRTAHAVVHTLTEQTGCDRFELDLEGSDDRRRDEQEWNHTHVPIKPSPSGCVECVALFEYVSTQDSRGGPA
jgi:hypothetical protein